jgi:hypothetical protein
MSDSNKILVIDPRWVPDTKTDWPTDRWSHHNWDIDFDFDGSSVAKTHSLLECRRDIAVPEARRQFRNPEEGELPSLEAVTRGLVKTRLTKKTYCLLT